MHGQPSTESAFARARDEGSRAWRLGSRLGVALLVGATSLPAMALYKVVAPDGSVTFTDRPVNVGASRVAPVRAGTPETSEVALPADLAAVASRYPVTLYVTGACEPCDDARRLLRQRGVPHSERTVATDDDVRALQRTIGTRELPAMTIGRQVVRGFQEQDWSGYLDAAGYPKTSRLPPGYRFSPAVPLTPPAAAEAPPVPAPAPLVESLPVAPAAGFRF